MMRCNNFICLISMMLCFGPSYSHANKIDYFSHGGMALLLIASVKLQHFGLISTKNVKFYLSYTFNIYIQWENMRAYICKETESEVYVYVLGVNYSR